MDFIDFLELDEAEESNVSVVMKFVHDFLAKIKASDFYDDDINLLTGTIDKFIAIAKRYGAPKDLNVIRGRAETLAEIMMDVSAMEDHLRRKKCMLTFTKLSSEIIRVYTQLIQNRTSDFIFSEVEILYNPDISDKEHAIQLIKEAIDLIKGDKNIPKKLKDKIVKNLSKILDNLEQESTNWTSYFGQVHQYILIFAALSTIASNVASISALNQASEKLVQATNVISSTSINQKVVNNNNFIVYNILDNINTCVNKSEEQPKLPENTSNNDSEKSDS
jgi:hypothetical protein